MADTGRSRWPMWPTPHTMIILGAPILQLYPWATALFHLPPRSGAIRGKGDQGHPGQGGGLSPALGWGQGHFLRITTRRKLKQKNGVQITEVMVHLSLQPRKSASLKAPPGVPRTGLFSTLFFSGQPNWRVNYTGRGRILALGIWMTVYGR